MFDAFQPLENLGALDTAGREPRGAGEDPLRPFVVPQLSARLSSLAAPDAPREGCSQVHTCMPSASDRNVLVFPLPLHPVRPTRASSMEGVYGAPLSKHPL